MSSARFPSSILVLCLLGLPLPALAQPSLPDTITSPNYSYIVKFINDNPYNPASIQPGDDLDYFPTSMAQQVANALDNSSAPSPGNPAGYHPGYTGFGFLAPSFGGDKQTLVFDCGPYGGCDSGNAPADRINLPAPMYITRSEPCIRLVMGHELFHHVQYSYITFGKWTQWGGVPVEGTARLMQDKIYGDLDANAGCITYLGESNGYLGNPNRTMWNLSYDTCLFWNYLMEQLGTPGTEPGIGVDFIRRFWENAETNNASPDTVGTIRDTIYDFNPGATLEGLFHDFSICNYAKDLNVIGLPNASKYRYVDENDGVSGNYNPVALAWSGTIPPQRGPVGSSVVRWGARYFEASIGGSCTGVVGFFSEGDTAAYSLIAVKGADQAVSLHKGVTNRFGKAFVQRGADPYTKLVAVVAGLNSNANFTYTFACGPLTIQIIRPTMDYLAYVGLPDSPETFLVRLIVSGPAALGTPSVEGLQASDFELFVGPEDPANVAPVLSGAYVGGEYWLVAQAPVKPEPGAFPLVVRIGDQVTSSQEQVVIYEKKTYDQVLVIDRSGSMLSPAGNTKLDAAKNAAGLFVDAAQANDKLGVVSFGGDNVEPNDDAELKAQLLDVTDAQRDAARRAIESLSTDPFVLTSIGDGMEKARQEFTLRGGPVGEDWIVLLSDGMENEALYWSGVRPAILGAGIKVNTIALGPNTDQALLQSIAHDTDGDYYYVDVTAPLPKEGGILAADDLPNRLADAYISTFEGISRLERVWQYAGVLPAGMVMRVPETIPEDGLTGGVFSINWAASTELPAVQIRRPDGSIVEDGVAGARVYSRPTHVVAQVGDIPAGEWQVTLSRTSSPLPYVIMLSARNPLGVTLQCRFSQPGAPVIGPTSVFVRGLPIQILATLSHPVAGPIIAAVTVTVQHPLGDLDTLALYDDGSHGDGAADDGTYGNLYTRTTEFSPTGLPDDPGLPGIRGSYNVTVYAQGIDPVKNPFRRTKRCSFQVFDGSSEQDPNPDRDRDGMPNRYEVRYPCLDPDKFDADLDPDGDGILSIDEYQLGTNPCRDDTDGGGESDGSEREFGRDPLDPRDDSIPTPVDVEVISWVLDHVSPPPDLRPNSNLIRYPLHPSYFLMRLYRGDNPDGPFPMVAEFDAVKADGLFRDEPLVNGTEYFYRIQAVGEFGNTSGQSHVFSGIPREDPFPPIGSIIINGGAPFTMSTAATLQLEADPDVIEMMLANEPSLAMAIWQTFEPELPWTLEPPPSSSRAAVYVRFRDKAGNESGRYFDDIVIRRPGSLGGIQGGVLLQGQLNHSGVLILSPSDSSVPPAFSDADGNFVLPGLEPGTYILTLEREGYHPLTTKEILVEAGVITTVGPFILIPIVPPDTPTPTETPAPATPTLTDTPVPPTTTPTPTGGGRECIVPGDVYPGPASDLELVDLGAVKFQAAQLPTGGFALLSVVDCSGDGALDVAIPWSETSALSLARIDISRSICGGAAPQFVQVFLQHGFYCILRAYDDQGNPVDTATADPGPAPQSLILSSPAGIRWIEIEGAEICVTRVCWRCEVVFPTPTPTPILPECISAHDVFPEPISQQEEIDLGAVRFTAARFATGAPAYMNVVDCSGDGLLDVQIPWSEATAMPRARMDFSQDLCAGSAPVWVQVTLVHYNSCTLRAYDDSGNEVSMAVAAPIPEPQILSLGSPAGIRYVEIEGAEICIMQVCWLCELPAITPTSSPTPQVTDTPTRTPTATRTNTPTSTSTPSPTQPDVVMHAYLPIMSPYIVAQPMITQDLSIHGIEVTQAIQHFDASRGVPAVADNSVPLVIRKSTAARIYLRYTNSLFAGAERDNTPVRFYIRRTGDTVWTTALVSAVARGTIDQSAANRSANVFFYVDSGAATFSVDLYAVVDPDDVVSESNESNNRYPAAGYVTLVFHRRDPIQVIGERLDYHPAGYTGTRQAAGWAVNGGGAQWWNAVLPLPDGGVEYSIASGYLDWTTTLNADGQHALIQHLNSLYVLANLFSILFTGEAIPTDHMYGWCPADGYTGGHADMPMYPHAGGLGVVAIGTDVPGTSVDNPARGAKVFGHELCHTYNVQHTDTGADDCGADDSSSDFPYATSSIQEFGFNPTTSKVYNPASTHDLMSYCPPASKEPWISPFHWTKMYNGLAAGKPRSKPLTPGETLEPNVFYITQDTSSLMVSAVIQNPTMAGEYGGTLGPLYLVDTGAALVVPEGEYAIELRDGATVLSRRAFAVSFANDWETPGYTEPEYPDAEMSMIIPWVTGTTSVVLLYGDTILDENPVSPNPPTVTITFPDAPIEWFPGETAQVGWTANDLDGDALTFSVFYSHNDGGTWQLLAKDLDSLTYQVPVDTLAGGLHCRFRVVASDGVNTAYDETDSQIVIPRKAPLVTITNPVSGSRFAPGGLVLLQGIATDLEDGALPGSALTWSSDLQGDLGTGESLPLTTLQVGTHTITLTATDSDAMSSGEEIEITVNTLEEFAMDLNEDGFIDQADLLRLIGRWKQSVDQGYPPSKADFNRDGTVDAVDLFQFQQYWKP